MSRQKRHGKINIRYHDLKQQYSRATDEERARLEEEMDNLNLRYLTGNKALDITLTQKSALCGQAGIQLVCSADGSCLEDMKHYHIYSLLGNALDNAIECLTQVNDASKRVITLDISRCRDMAVIRVQNYTPAPPTLRDGAIVTTKRDTEEHGYGIKASKALPSCTAARQTALWRTRFFIWWSPSPAGKAKKKLHNPKATAERQSLFFFVICAAFFDICANSIDPVNASLYDSFVKKI